MNVRLKWIGKYASITDEGVCFETINISYVQNRWDFKYSLLHIIVNDKIGTINIDIDLIMIILLYLKRQTYAEQFIWWKQIYSRKSHVHSCRQSWSQEQVNHLWIVASHVTTNYLLASVFFENIPYQSIVQFGHKAFY